MKIAIGDIIDRYSICLLKKERLKIDNNREIMLLKEEIKKYEGTDIFIDELYKVNGLIWDLESDIRKGNEDVLGLEEVGRRAIKIREHNNVRVSIKNEINSNYNEGFIEVKMSHGSRKEPSVIITLSTVPERLEFKHDNGLIKVIKKLCEQNDDNYEIHFNIPNVSMATKKEYIIPQWLEDFKLKYPHLRVFRTEDLGPPTKLIPTLNRVKNEETIILTVDDDLFYHEDMIKEHRKYQKELIDVVVAYEGRGSSEKLYEDRRNGMVYCVTLIRDTHNIQHFKSASYKRKLFKPIFFEKYVGKTFSDDVLVSKYFQNENIQMRIVPYEPENHLFDTFDKWKINSRVETFPVLGNATIPSDTGTKNPEMLKIQHRFYEPKEYNTLRNANK